MAETQTLAPPAVRPNLRRLSSMTATVSDLKQGSVVVVPERMLQHARANTYCGFAAMLLNARNELTSIDLEKESNIPLVPKSQQSANGIHEISNKLSTADSFAFAFDIDGVLIRGGRPIPQAIEAMKVLNGENEYGIKM